MLGQTAILSLICGAFLPVISAQINHGPFRPNRPNILFVLTDDLDFELGGMTPLAKTRGWIKDRGVSFDYSFVTTPICCPSRASTLTGLYQHNTKVNDQRRQRY